MTVLGDPCEVIYVDDERIKKHFIRELEGVVDIHYHYEPRMVGVYSLPIQAKMWDGEYVEVELDEEVAMLGVITELAAHHPRARLYVNGVNQTPQYLDTFLMGQVDGIGCIKWFILPTGKKKTVRLQVTGSYNPIMPEKQRARGSGFCFGGFIILFLDGAYIFTVSDLAFKTGEIGLAAFGGKAEFDNVSVWSD